MWLQLANGWRSYLDSTHTDQQSPNKSQKLYLGLVQSPFKCSQFCAWSTGLKPGNALLAKGSAAAHQGTSQARHQISLSPPCPEASWNPSLFYLL